MTGSGGGVFENEMFHIVNFIKYPNCPWEKYVSNRNILEVGTFQVEIIFYIAKYSHS